jgi:hypothetical protein
MSRWASPRCAYRCNQAGQAKQPPPGLGEPSEDW